jgi:DNA-binding transcriptional LysR family regulator
MAEGLKAMALEGHGLAFLPGSSVAKEVRARRLVRAAPAGRYELAIEIRIYRERPEVARRVRPAAQALWEHLRRDDAPVVGTKLAAPARSRDKP